MVFNRRILNMISSRECYEILRDEKYNEYLNSKVNRNNPSFVTKGEDLALFDAFDNYLAYSLLNDPTALNDRLMAKYRDYLFAIFQQMPDVVFDSVLFNKEPAQLLFTNEQYREIAQYKKRASMQCENIYNKVRRNQPLTRQEQNLLLNFLIKNLRNEDSKTISLLDDIYSRLLNNNLKLNSLLAKEFVLKYTAELARRDLHIPQVEVYLSNITIDGKVYSSKNYGTSYGNTGIITVNKDSIDKEISPIPGISSIIKFMQTVCHETKHSSQAYNASINDLSYEAFEYIRTNILRTYLSQENFNEYKANYRHNEIERDANLYGWKMVEKILNKSAPKRKEEINTIISQNIRVFYQASLANKRDTKRRMPKEYYNVKMMDDIVLKHPDLIRENAILSYIYSSTGRRKPFTELIRSNKTLSRSTGSLEIDKIFYDYFISDIKNGILNVLNLNALQREQQFELFDRLTTILLTEITLIRRSMRILDDKNMIEFERVNLERVSRISYLLNYLNRNKNLINSLISIDISEGNKRGFGMYVGYIDDQLQSLQRAFKRNSTIKETAIYNNLMTLSGGEIHGPHL